MKQGHFGKYILLDRIAVGGMAEIYLSQQKGLEGFEKAVVLKMVLPHLASHKSFIKMFLNEGKLAAQLNHSNIVQIYELGKEDDTYYIAMEYVPGRDMRGVIPRANQRNIPFPLEYALRITSEVCEGLFYAHTKKDTYGRPLNIVHRDITPENIMVSFEGAVKITDFGIAKAATQIEHTRAGEIKGKLSYMSPEQCRGEALDPRSDIFTLGTILYEWLTGYKLFTGDSEADIIRSIMESKIYPPSYFKEDIPPKVEKIVMRCIELDKNKRYQNTREVQYDIDGFFSNHHFTPSNFHLSNFMKQLFSEDLKEESLRFQLKHQEIKAITMDDRPSGDEQSKSGSSSKSSSRTINIDEDTYKLLKKWADKRGRSPKFWANRIIKGFLKTINP